MNEAQITVIGWVAAEPYYSVTGNGTPYLSLRVGCTPRRYDRRSAQWQDLETMFLTVNCWRTLADNVNASEIKRGHPVVVTGRLRIRQYEKDGQWRFSADIEATTVGHDLNRGTADFRPVVRSAGLTEDDRREVHEATDQWALAGPLAAPAAVHPGALLAGEAGSSTTRPDIPGNDLTAPRPEKGPPLTLFDRPPANTKTLQDPQTPATASPPDFARTDEPSPDQPPKEGKARSSRGRHVKAA
ncbi:single-stranded DNA-binding protein [Actinomadura macrotermitis]|uniref:Single-stranded DNA-binding protein n=1 Tax=Actinomadura macrotermitis TaxID=2585200 RepID=A0A7K0BYX1_9ACTN|nr:Single-stranded DNA-binding protein [Actinomadura macrotermitis]